MYTTGNCITRVQDGQVCPQRSVAFECVADTQTAETCLCDQEILFSEMLSPDDNSTGSLTGLLLTDANDSQTAMPACLSKHRVCVPVRLYVITPHNVAGFFPFGERNGDSRVPQAIDLIVGPEQLAAPINFYQKQEDSYYVSQRDSLMQSRTSKNLFVSGFY